MTWISRSSVLLMLPVISSAWVSVQSFPNASFNLASRRLFFWAGLHFSNPVIVRAMSVSESDRSFSVGQADIGASSINSIDPVGSGGSTNGKSWRMLLEASSNKTRKTRGSNYVQIATVDPENKEPRNRCVVFRGFLNLPEGHSKYSTCGGLSCLMKMITDLRSEKVSQVMAHPTRAAEMVWWFPTLTEQYRIRGELLFVGNGPFEFDNDKELANARKQMWGNISDSSRESFLDPLTPGQCYEEPSAVTTPGGRDASGSLVPPPDNFLLMLLVPRHVDYLRLKNMFRQVDVLSSGTWTSERLNP